MNGEKIVKAIEGENIEWEKPDGTPRESNASGMIHYTC